MQDLFNKNFLFDGKSIRKGKNTVKEKYNRYVTAVH